MTFLGEFSAATVHRPTDRGDLLSPDGYSLYARLVAGAAHVVDVEDLLPTERELIDCGLATLESPAGRHSTVCLMQAVAPFVAAQRLAAEQATKMAHWERQATAFISRITELYAARPADPMRRIPDVQLLTEQSTIAAVSSQITREVRTELLELDTIASGRPPASTERAATHGDREQPVSVRAICESAFLDGDLHPAIDARVASGQAVKVLAKIPAAITIADRKRALVTIDAGWTACLLVQTSRFVEGLVALFELLWAQAVPYGRNRQPGDHLTTRERAVLQLLACGLKDDAVARKLGLAVRTVRRHINAIMIKLQADTRFAAGIQAHARGWLTG